MRVLFQLPNTSYQHESLNILSIRTIKCSIRAWVLIEFSSLSAERESCHTIFLKSRHRYSTFSGVNERGSAIKVVTVSVILDEISTTLHMWFVLHATFVQFTFMRNQVITRESRLCKRQSAINNNSD